MVTAYDNGENDLLISRKNGGPFLNTVTWKQAYKNGWKYYHGKYCTKCRSYIRQLGYGNPSTSHQKNQCYVCKLIRDAAYRAKMRMSSLSITEQLIIKEIYKTQAAWNSVHPGNQVHVHHIIPLQQDGANGTHQSNNLIILAEQFHKDVHANGWKYYVKNFQNHIAHNPYDIYP